MLAAPETSESQMHMHHRGHAASWPDTLNSAMHDAMRKHASVPVAPEISENQMLVHDRSHAASAAGQTLSIVS